MEYCGKLKNENGVTFICDKISPCLECRRKRKVSLFDRLFSSVIIEGKRMVWIGTENYGPEHRHDYRWIKDKRKREKWIKDHYKEC